MSLQDDNNTRASLAHYDVRLCIMTLHTFKIVLAEGSFYIVVNVYRTNHFQKVVHKRPDDRGQVRYTV